MATKKKTTKKKTAKKKQAAKRGTSKSMVSMETYLAQMEKEASADSARTGDATEAHMISIRDKRFTYQGADLGDTMEVVILNFANQKTYYDRPWKEDEPSSPACWAHSIETKPSELTADPEAPKVQCDVCSECWANEFGSAANGSGKACGDVRKMALVTTDLLDEDVEDIEVAMLKAPSASVTNFDKFVKGLSKVAKRPTYGVVAEISFVEDEKYPKLQFHYVTPIESPAYLEKIMQLRDRCYDELNLAYDPSGYVEPSAKPASKKKTAKKKASKKKTARKRNF